MKKVVKIIGCVIILAVILLVLSIENGIYGNPISKALANYNADKYIEEHYEDLNLTKGKAGYHMKIGEYFVPVQSQDSIDTAFRIYFDGSGNVLSDNYDEIGDNTWYRLDNEIHRQVEEILKEKFPEEDNKINAYMIDGDVDRELPQDMPLDIANTPAPIQVSIQTYSDDQTYENVATIMAGAQETLGEKGVEVALYNVVIIPLKDKVDDFEGVSWAEALAVFDIPAELLNEENPVEAIKDYDEHKYDDSEE